MQLNCIIIFLLCISTNSYSQSTITPSSSDNSLSIKGDLSDALNDRVLLESGNNSENQGSPYLYDDWFLAHIITADSNVINKLVPTKIDIFRNQICAKNDAGKELALKSSKVLGIEMLDDKGFKRVFKRYFVKQKYLPYYCEVLYESPKIIFLTHHVKVFKRADYVQRGVVSSGSPFDRFELEDDTYYVKLGGKEFQKIELTRKNFIEQFSPSNQTILQEFCKKNNIGKRLDNSSITILCTYANSIL